MKAISIIKLIKDLILNPIDYKIDKAFNALKIVDRELIEQLKPLLQELHRKVSNKENVTTDGVNEQILLLARIMHKFEKNGIALEHAKKLTTIFQDADSVCKYVLKYIEKNPRSKCPFHDSSLFSLPEEKINLKFWRAISLDKYNILNEKFSMILKNSYDIEKLLSSNKSDSGGDKIIVELDLVKKCKPKIKQLVGVKIKLKKLKEKIKISKDQNKSFGKVESLLASLKDKISKLENQILQTFNKNKNVKKLSKDKFEKYFKVQKDVFLSIEKIVSKESILKKLNNKKSDLTDQEEKDRQKLNSELSRLKVKLADSYLSLGLVFEDLFSYDKRKKKSILSKNALSVLDCFYEKVKSQMPGYEILVDNGLTKKDIYKYRSLKPISSDKKIPPIKIDGKDISMQYKDYYFIKLKPSDPRIPVLGKLTKCCQSIGEAGSECAIHAIISPNGGICCICKGDVKNPKITDEVIAQSWVWVSKKGNLVIDSIERKDSSFDKMIRCFYSSYIKNINNIGVLKQVSIGVGSGVSDIHHFEVNTNEKPIDYNGYRDSKVQKLLISDNPFFNLHLLDGNEKEREVLLNSYIKKNKKNIPMVINNYINYNMFLSKKFKFFDEQPKKYRNFSKNQFKIAIKNNTNIKKDDIEDIFKVNNKFYKLFDDIICDHCSVTKGETNSYILKQIKELVSAGANVNSFVCSGDSPLIWALRKGYKEISRLLIEVGADCKVISSDGKTALILAMYYNDIAKLLIEKGVDLDLSDDNGNTPLMLAIERGQTELAKLLIKNGANLNEENDYGETAFMLAIDNNEKEIFEMLIEKGITLNEKNKKDYLMCAVKQGFEGAVKFLIEKGTNLNEVYSISNEFESGSDDANNKKIKKTALMLAIKEGHEEIVELLIEKGASLSVSDHDGNTALIVAIKENKKEIVKLLIKKGADCSVSNKSGKTAFIFSINNFDKDICTLFIKKGISFDLKNKNYWEFLVSLLTNRLRVRFRKIHNEKALKFIFNLNIDLCLKNNQETFLHSIVKNSYKYEPSIVAAKRCLTAIKSHENYKKYLNLKDKEGDTAFHIAAKKGYLKFIVGFIEGSIKKGIIIDSKKIEDIIDLSCKDKNGKSVYDLLANNKDILNKMENLRPKNKVKGENINKVIDIILNKIKSLNEINKMKQKSKVN